jgi:signal transduction histidine kinase
MKQISEKPNTGELRRQLEVISQERLKLLVEISTILSSTLDLSQLLDMVIDTATNLTNTEYASILLLDQMTGKLQIAATSGTKLVENSVVPLEGSMAGWIVREGQPLILDDATKDGRDFVDVESSGQFFIQNMLGVPMVAKERVIGALEVINKRGEVSYSQQDKALLQALASQAAVAIENARLFQQTDLISEFMHELKTPLMALTAASELLSREIVDENQKELINMIQRETVRLSKMAQDFLDLARLESGRARIKFEPVDLSELVRDVVGLQDPQAAAYGITIYFRVSDTIPIISGDYDRLKQVLLNLTNNAIKYNVEQGRVSIEVKDHDGEVMIAVADTGPGIEQEYLDHLFQRFYRIPDKEGFTGGTGLGLSISARILKEHGGRIEVESELGRGSVFRCYLPKSRRKPT